MRKLAICFLILGELVLAGGLAAQSNSSETQSEVSCKFADGKQITVRYNRVPFKKGERLRENKI